MARVALNDKAWEKVREALQRCGRYITKDTRTIIEAIIWKIRTGSPWRDIPSELGPWKTAYNRFNRMAEKGVWDDFFLLFEEKLKRSGYSPTEVMFELTSMRVDVRLILKSLGVTSTTSKLRQS